MARLPKPGGDDGTWGQILNDFLAQTHKVDGTLKDNVVTSSTIAPGTVTVTEIADGSITTAKLATSLQTSISGAVQSSAVGQPSGVASLGTDGKVPTAQLPASSGGTTGAVLWNTATAPTAAQNGDLWLDASSSTTEAYIRARINNQWVLFATATKPTSGGGGFTTTSMPTNATATPAETSVVLQWNAPIEIAGTLQGYRVYQGSTQLNSSSIPATTLTYTVQGLTAATPYTFTIRAVTTSGEGAGADVVVTTTAAGGGSGGSSAPAAPTNVQATGGNAQATVSFTGSSGATSYTVTANPGGVTGTGSSSPITVTGLTNGTSYTFTVTATNANGTSSPSSQSASVTPAASGGGGNTSRSMLMWHNGFIGPALRDYPSDVKNNITQYSLGMAQSASSGTGLIAYNPGHNQAEHAADIRALVASGKDVIIGIGGSGSGGIYVTNTTQAQQMIDSINGIVSTYGINGIDIDLEPGSSDWNNEALGQVCTSLRSTHGSSFVISVTTSLYSPHDAKWMSFLSYLGHDNYTQTGPMLYDFPESQDSRLTGVTLDKAQYMANSGVPDNKMMFGYMLQPSAGYNASPNVGVINDAFNAVKAARPNVKGAFFWVDDIDMARNWEWARGAHTSIMS